MSGEVLSHEALEATLRHFVGSLDTHMEKHLDTHGLWPALTRGFAESYEESLTKLEEAV